jgi:hypothetical protein
MVGQARVSIAYQHERTFDMASLRRLAIWGGAASLALLAAVVASYSDANSRRLMAADAQKAGEPSLQAASRLPEIDAQTQRLAGVVDGLAADRERMAARIGTIERNLEDVTGAIKRQSAESGSAKTAALAAPPSGSAASAAAAPATKETVKESAKEVPNEVAMAPVPGPLDILAARQPAVAPEAPPEAHADLPAIRSDDTTAADPPHKVEFGVDVGGALNFDGLRLLWTSTKGSNATLFESLYPVVAVRENSRTKNAELRLVVGPLANVETAARLCASLSAARRYCQPVAFEGQRLAEPDAAPERRAAPAAPKPKVAAPAPKPRGLFP